MNLKEPAALEKLVKEERTFAVSIQDYFEICIGEQSD